jgi:hypothetical protein
VHIKKEEEDVTDACLVQSDVVLLMLAQTTSSLAAGLSLWKQLPPDVATAAGHSLS